MKNIFIFLMVVTSLLTGCRKEINSNLIIIKAENYFANINSIKNTGVELCDSQVLEQKLVIKNSDFRPDRFDGQKNLSVLIGSKIHFVSFYMYENKAIGMLMWLDLKKILYCGDSLDEEIHVAGRNFKKTISSMHFSIYEETANTNFKN